MQGIRDIFDGKTFVPEQPVTLPPQARVTVFVDEVEPLTPEQIDQQIRVYYEQGGEDEEDFGWFKYSEKDLSQINDDEG